MKTLVIVESPSKCKKIEEYLGAGYTCAATCGHLRTIPSLQHIGPDFQPTYELLSDKRHIETLRKRIQAANEVIIASDNDREGEMIGQSIIELYHLPVNTKRIVFNEITPSALQYAIRHPTTINANLVDAQKTRQILDVLVGFKVSPVLWKLVARKEQALSAGRCQTPALRLVYDNQREIDRATPTLEYHMTGYFTKRPLVFELNARPDEPRAFLEASKSFAHVYTCSTPVKKHTSPPTPFTTCRLQQAASNEYRYAPKETMRICQQLYEAGYITYMRTDSEQYSVEFIETAHAYIRAAYSERHVGPTKAPHTASAAHEAIRPTDISRRELSETVDAKQRKMYKLIWTNTVESCMAAATYWSVTASITAPMNHRYTHTAEQCEFPGWTAVQSPSPSQSQDYVYLQTITPQSTIPYKKICARSTMTGTKSHYTEARLVQLLEEKGIGRPSTFAAILDKLIERQYVRKQDVPGKDIACIDYELEGSDISQTTQIKVFGKETGKLVIQPIGVIVVELLETYFQALFDYEYTRHMELDLDRIAQGALGWRDVCARCNDEIDQLIETTRAATKFEVALDEHHTYIVGRYGPVIKCVEDNVTTFKAIKSDADIHQVLAGEVTVDDIATTKAPSQIVLGTYDGQDVVLRKGKYGLYAVWGKETKTLKELGNRPIDNITLDEVTAILKKGTSTIVREISPHVSIRKGPKGDYLFHKTPTMKKPAFYPITPLPDYKTCHMDVLRAWIATTYPSVRL